MAADGAAGAIGFGTAVPDGGGIRGGGPGATGPLAKAGVAAGAPGRISTNETTRLTSLTWRAISVTFCNSCGERAIPIRYTEPFLASIM